MKLRLTLLFGLIAVIAFAENVVITNPKNQPVTMRVVGFMAAATPATTVTPTPTPGGVLTDGAAVSTWIDSSGAGHTATQTGTARPTFKTNILNGKPVVRFTSAGLSGLNLATPVFAGAPFTTFVVMKATGPTVNLYALASSGAAAPFSMVEYHDGTLFCAGRQAYCNVATDYTGAFHVFTGIIVGSGSGTVFVDGVNTAAPALVGSWTTDFDRIGYDAFTPLYSNGDIAEIIHYNVSYYLLTEQNAIEKYLGAKYGITVAGGGVAADPSTVTGLQGWWKADSLGP